MKNIPFYAILLCLLFACNERFDTSQWKDDVAIFKPNKITAADFELFVRADAKEYVESRMALDFGKTNKPVGYIYSMTLTDTLIPDSRDQAPVAALLTIEDKVGYYDHYEERGDTLCYFTRLVHSDNKETVVKFYLSKSDIAKEIARQNDLKDTQSD